jgi:hypothetical protein
MLMIDNADRFGIIHIERRKPCNVIAREAAAVRGLRCQHFLKREAVFFDALVYSRGSVFRFPNARSD